jgi:predicted transcriptional regulator
MTKQERDEAIALKRKLIYAGYGVNDLADRLEQPYSTIYSQVSGYTPLTDSVRRMAEEMIKERSK